ncbi:hypothetical protein QA597_04155 [Marinilabiliaceae bacterium ANBcel2]|nr:hypothetical protein [Marinilabiliaceae bacterium ANBcel2]
MRLIYFFFLIFALSSLCSCSKSEHPVPNRRFEVYFPLDRPEFQEEVFQVSRYYTGRQTSGSANSGAGVSGLIIYKQGYNQYNAYDRYCPNDRNSSCIVSVNFDDPFYGVCNCCESEFLISNPAAFPSGAPVLEGPAGHSLKQYRTRVENNYLIVWN